MGLGRTFDRVGLWLLRVCLNIAHPLFRLRLRLKRAPEDAEIATLRMAFNRYGPVPRTVFDGLRAIRDPNLVSNKEQSLQDALEELTLKQFRALVKEARSAEPSSSLSHEIICMSRPDGVPIERFEISVAPLSPDILTRLIKSAMFRAMEEKREAFRILSGKTETSVYRGWILECYAHIILSSPSHVIETANPTNARLELIKLIPSRGKTMACPSSSLVSNDHFPLVERDIRVFDIAEDWAAKPVVDDVYHQPDEPNNPGFDSFVVSGNVAYIFQVTASAQHSVDSKHQAGIELLTQFIPSRATIWRYILVVPHNVKDYKLTGVSGRWLDRRPQKEFYIASLDLKK